MSITAKGVKCENCKFCDKGMGWCRIKALVVAVRSVRTCKIYAEDKKGG